MITKAQIKYIQSLNEKKFRAEHGVFVAEGPRLINDLLGAPNIEPLALYATDEWWQSHKELQNNVPFVSFYQVSLQELSRLSFLTTPHQVVGIFKKPSFSAGPSVKNKISLLLDGIQDPGNFGTIVRIADWFGLDMIIASHDSVDVFNPKVVQSTMGSIARVNVIYDSIESVINANRDIAVYASVLEGQPLAGVGKIQEGMLVIGNEARGIKNELLELAMHRITIPGTGRAESLNAAVATGIILSHIK